MKNMLRLASLAVLALALAAPAMADTILTATLQGSQETIPTGSPASGSATVDLNAAETQITVNMSFSGLVGSETAAHIHGPAPRGVNAGVIFPLTVVPVGSTSGTVTNQVIAVTPAQAADFRAGLWYVNVHSTSFPGGEIRGQLDGGLPIPAATPWGLVMLCVLLAAAGVFYLLRR